MRKILIANKGMILTDGETFGVQIFLAVGEDGKNFYEITREEYDKIMKIREVEEFNNGRNE